MAAVAVAYVLFTSLYPFPGTSTPKISTRRDERLQAPGSCHRASRAYIIDMKHTRFETKAPIWVQIVKVVVGFGLLMAIKEGLKAPLAALLPGPPPRG
jgi:hypothetical protein